jgi:dCTP deaminase
MLLSDKDIRTYVLTGSLGVEPFDEEMIQPSSIDVRLDKVFRVMNGSTHSFIDPAEEQTDLFERVVVPDGEAFILRPGEFALATTYERVVMPDDLAGRLEGKSSLGRLGLLVHTTAGFIDPGFSGQITLELVNLAHWPIKLWPGMKIGQLCLMLMTSAARYPYGHEHNGSHYQDQRGPTPSRSHLGFHRTRL